MVAASPAYLKRSGEPSVPEDLRHHHCVRYTAGVRGTWPYRAADGRQGAIRVDGRIQSNNGEYLRDCLLRGFGIGLLPDFVLQDTLRSGALVACLRDYTWFSAGIYALFPHRMRLPTRVRALVDHLDEVFRSFDAAG